MLYQLFPTSEVAQEASSAMEGVSALDPSIRELRAYLERGAVARAMPLSCQA